MDTGFVVDAAKTLDDRLVKITGGGVKKVKKGATAPAVAP